MSTPAAKIVRNLTPKRLHIKGAKNSLLVLAPLEKDRRVSTEELESFDLDCLESRNLIKVSNETDARFEAKIAALLPVVGMALFFTFSLGNAFTKANPTANRWFWIISIPTVLLGLAGAALFSWKGKYVVLRLLAQSFSLLLILAFGIALPALAIYYFGGGRELLAGKPSLVMLGRTLQLVFIVTASLLPSLLYFLFDRQQLGTLRDRFEHQIFRLDPNVETLVDVQAKYGKQISEIYGPVLATDEGRLLRGTRWPIFVATLVITMGWILTLLPAEANLAITHPNEILNLLMPRRTAVVFGFLGVYFFALNMSLLRYARADLKPKAYSSIAVRFFIVVIMAWVIGLAFTEGNAVLLTIVFLVGIFPESGLTLIRESIREQSGLAKIIPYPKEQHPLTDLEGIDIYDRARLADEGVTNIEGLAHHDLIDLMLETRIPVPRLVDWLDQAILYLHLTPTVDKNEESTANNGGGKDVSSLRSCLRDYGIRTATDLMKAYKEEKLPAALGDKENESRKRIDIVLIALQDDEWVDYISHWRDNNRVRNEEYLVPALVEPSITNDSSQEAAALVTGISIGNERAMAGNGGQA
jgi:hypothetical protein